MNRLSLGSVVWGCVLAAGVAATAQQPSPHGHLDFETAGHPLAVQPVDPQIAAALRDVSPAEMRKTIEALVSFRNRNTVGSTDTDLPAGTGVLAAEAWIRQRFEQISAQCGGCLEIHEDRFLQPPQTGPHARVLRPTPIINVYAILPGTDPTQSARRVLVSGHYDSFFIRDPQDAKDPAPGANDDASGTAVSLECARVLSKHRFPATIVFISVAGEEQGLLGSTHLATLAKRQGWDIEAMLNNDIVGGDTTPGDTANEDKTRVRVFSTGIPLTATPEQMERLAQLGAVSDSGSRELARAVADIARTYTLSAPLSARLRPVLEMRLDRFLRGGDHSSFNREGFSAVRFTEWREDFNHQHQEPRVEHGVQFGDLIQFDDFAYMAKVARLNAATLATLVSAPAEPSGITMRTHNLDNNTLLAWKPPVDPMAGEFYQVVWRETSAPDWQFGAPAKTFHPQTDNGVVTITIPVSKDNVFFGVRACDAHGHCSPAVMPMPSR